MPLPYKKFFFFYPPRPETSLPPSTLKNYNSVDWIGQAKLNGSNGTVYNNEKELHLYNRHKAPFKYWKVDVSDLLPKKGWWAVNGEYMNKSQKDLDGKLFNHKFVIFDLLVANSRYLLGTTFEERLDMLIKLLNPVQTFDPYLWQLSDDIYMVKPVEGDFLNHYNIMTKATMYEGLVLKKKTGKLESGLRQVNTALTQFKFRKKTKNYSY